MSLFLLVRHFNIALLLVSFFVIFLFLLEFRFIFPISPTISINAFNDYYTNTSHIMFLLRLSNDKKKTIAFSLYFSFSFFDVTLLYLFTCIRMNCRHSTTVLLLFVSILFSLFILNNCVAYIQRDSYIVVSSFSLFNCSTVLLARKL